MKNEEFIKEIEETNDRLNKENDSLAKRADFGDITDEERELCMSAIAINNRILLDNAEWMIKAKQ